MDPAAEVAGLVLFTETSEETLVVVEAVALLFPAFGSEVEEETLAVLLMTLPAGVEAAIWTTKLKVAVVPDTRVAAVQVMEPLAPGEGVLQVKAGPLF